MDGSCHLAANSCDSVRCCLYYKRYLEESERGGSSVGIVIQGVCVLMGFFFFSSRRRHTRSDRDWSSDVCSSDLRHIRAVPKARLKTGSPELRCDDKLEEAVAGVVAIGIFVGRQDGAIKNTAERPTDAVFAVLTDEVSDVPELRRLGQSDHAQRGITVKLLAGCVLPPIVQCRHEPSNDAAILDEATGGHLFSKAEAMTESQRIV